MPPGCGGRNAMHEIISRKEAIERGLTRYFTGKPCKYGHLSERNVTWAGCLECAKMNARKSREENPHIHRAAEIKWRTANREKRRLIGRKWREKNPSKIKAYEKSRDQEKKREASRRYEERHKAGRREDRRQRGRKAFLALAILKRAGIEI